MPRHDDREGGFVVRWRINDRRFGRKKREFGHAYFGPFASEGEADTWANAYIFPEPHKSWTVEAAEPDTYYQEADRDFWTLNAAAITSLPNQTALHPSAYHLRDRYYAYSAAVDLWHLRGRTGEQPHWPHFRDAEPGGGTSTSELKASES